MLTCIFLRNQNLPTKIYLLNYYMYFVLIYCYLKGMEKYTFIYLILHILSFILQILGLASTYR